MDQGRFVTRITVLFLRQEMTTADEMLNPENLPLVDDLISLYGSWSSFGRRPTTPFCS